MAHSTSIASCARPRRTAADDADCIRDDDGDEDEEDEPPRPCEIPEGFLIAANLPPAETLEPKNDAQEILVGASLLYRWPSVGWCVGVIKEANSDRCS